MTLAGLSTESVTLPRQKGRMVVAALLVLAVVAGIDACSQWSADPRRFAFSYLTAFLFVASLSLGSLAWLMLHHVTGATWSVVLRRLIENLTQPLGLIIVLFVPIAFSLPRLYTWAESAQVAADPELARKAGWLNPVAFDVRAAIYLIAWGALATVLARKSSRQDQTGAPDLTRRMRAISAGGLVVLGWTTSFAAFDWLMSLDAHWSSTIFGVYFWTGSLVSSLASLILLVLCLRSAGWLRTVVTTEHLHDLAKLLFSFVVFWAYIAFSQYFLIWYANLPEETRWYVARRSGTWNDVSWALVIGHFVVPFVLLLFRATRRSPLWLGFTAAWVLCFHYVDLFWQAMPALHPEGVQPSRLDLSVLLMLVFFCAAIVARSCLERPLIPIGDPCLAESLAFRNS